jgi:hypothetical protein
MIVNHPRQITGELVKEKKNSPIRNQQPRSKGLQLVPLDAKDIPPYYLPRLRKVTRKYNANTKTMIFQM